ncbi:MAG: hypothetical protein ABGY41_18685, partial [Candidatus Poribacteria bacterium]
RSDWVETHTGAGEASLTMPGSYVNAGDALVGHPDFDWRVVPMSSDSMLHFDTLFQPDVDNKHITAYAFTIIISPHAQEIALTVIGDDLIAVWANGKRLKSDLSMDNMALGFDQFRISLREGANAVLVKLSHNDESRWSAEVQFPAGSGLRSSLDASAEDPRALTTVDAWVSINRGLPSPSVTSLATLDDTLYAGTMDEGVSRYDAGEDRWTPLREGMTTEYVNELTPVGSVLYAGTRDGVFRLSDDAWERVGLEGEVVTALTTSDSALFAATWGGAIFRSDEQHTEWTQVDGEQADP